MSFHVDLGEGTSWYCGPFFWAACFTRCSFTRCSFTRCSATSTLQVTSKKMDPILGSEYEGSYSFGFILGGPEFWKLPYPKNHLVLWGVLVLCSFPEWDSQTDLVWGMVYTTSRLESSEITNAMGSSMHSAMGSRIGWPWSVNGSSDD